MKQASVRAHLIAALCRGVGLRGVTAPDLELLARRVLKQRSASMRLAQEVGVGGGSEAEGDVLA
jgi:hypothetical protein